MAISNSVMRISYAGNGVQTTFPFPYAYYSYVQLLVYVDNVLQSYGSYSVTPTTLNPEDGNPLGGTVTFVSAPANGTVVQIIRSLILEQTVVLNDGSNFPAKTIEKNFDQVVMMLQQQNEAMSRALVAPITESLDMSLPAASSRKNGYLAFDSNGKPIIAASPSITGTTVLATGTTTARTLGERFAEEINVKDMGAAGDGVTNDLAAILAAVAVSKKLVFPEGTYNLGALGLTPPFSLIDVDGGGGAISFRTIGKVKFVCTTQASTVTYLFKFQNATSCYLGPMQFEDLGYDPNITWKGAGAILLYADASSGPLTNVSIPSLYCTHVVAPITIGAYNLVNRVKTVNIGTMTCESTFYGFVCQDNGDYVNIDLLKTRDCVRSYFVYGVNCHRANVFSVDGRQSDADCNITAYGDTAHGHPGFDSQDIKIRFSSRNSFSNDNHIGLHTIGTDRAVTIKNVEIDADIDTSICNQIAHWRDYPGSNLPENTGATNNYLDNIRLNGRINSTLGPGVVKFTIGSQPVTIGKIYFDGDFSQANIANAARSYLELTCDQAQYSPVWTGATVNPVIGNGSVNGRYMITNGMMDYYGIVVAGTTTTFGTGEMRFSLPFTPVNGVGIGAEIPCGVAMIFIPGVAFYTGALMWQSGRNYLTIYPDGALASMGSATYVWATGARISWHCHLPIGHDVP